MYPVSTERISAWRRDDGLGLAEVLVAILLMSIVAMASAGLFINGIAASATQERRQIAVTVASDAMEIINSVAPSDLLTGRYSANVATAWTNNSSIAGVAQTYQASDPAATIASSPLIPTTAVSTPPQGGTIYTVSSLVGVCFQPIAGGDCIRTGATATAPALPANYVQLIRAIVVVRWTAGTTCSAGCFYTTSTLVDPSADLQWVDHG